MKGLVGEAAAEVISQYSEEIFGAGVKLLKDGLNPQQQNSTEPTAEQEAKEMMELVNGLGKDGDESDPELQWPPEDPEEDREIRLEKLKEAM